MSPLRGALRQGRVSVGVSRTLVSLLYAYEEHGHTFIGCMQKVFEVEIDVDMLRAAEAYREGFGAIKAMRQPLPMCRCDVDACYSHRSSELGCVNPEFNELPAGSPTFRVFARL